MGFTYISNSVSTALSAQALCLACLFPGLEQVLKHDRLSSFTHNLHVGVGWVILGLDKALEEKEQWCGEDGHVKY